MPESSPPAVMAVGELDANGTYVINVLRSDGGAKQIRLRVDELGPVIKELTKLSLRRGALKRTGSDWPEEVDTCG